MNDLVIQRVRGFNRSFTRRIGALDESYLGRGRPLGLARLLFEIGPDRCDLKTLRDRLGLDSGYLSRQMRALEAEGLVRTNADPGDRRRRLAVLTEAGRAEWAAYDQLSNEFAQSLLAPLGDKQRERLMSAMDEVDRLISAASITIEDEPADSTDARSCLAAYFRELDARFDNGFNPEIAGSASRQSSAPPMLAFLLARLDGRPVGCGVLYRLGDDTAEIKRMWVAPQARGIGIAGRLLQTLEDEARKENIKRILLDTNHTLDEARSLYERSGYRAISRYNDNPYADFWYEKILTGNDRIPA